MKSIKKSVLSLCVLGLSAFGTPAIAKYPERAVTIVVPYSAGGVTDVYARAIGA